MTPDFLIPVRDLWTGSVSEVAIFGAADRDDAVARASTDPRFVPIRDLAVPVNTRRLIGDGTAPAESPGRRTR